MSKGAYLIIEHTEALHVIDVNSGNRSNKAQNQEDTALEVNMIAAAEIARQLRLRDMGGIIVVDFIDMGNPENRKTLYDFLKEEMSDDKAKHKILPPSKFGLIQITRQRVRPEVNIKTREEDPNNENAEIEAPILVVDKIKASLERIIKDNKKVVLNAHPFVAAYLTQGFPSLRTKEYTKTHTQVVGELEDLKEEQKQLEYEVSLLEDEEYIAKLARQELNVSKPNEILINIPEKEEAKSDNDSLSEEEKLEKNDEES